MKNKRGSKNIENLNEHDNRVLSENADIYFENPAKFDESLTDAKITASAKSIVFCPVDKCFPVKF